MSTLFTPSSVTHITQGENSLVSPACRDSKTVLIFANPIAGRGQSLATAERLSAALSSAGYCPHLVLTPPLESALPLPPYHAAIAIGGDGTLRSVVSRLCVPTAELSPSLTGPFTPPPPILVIPTGTANLMRQSLDLPRKTEKHALRLLGDYHIVPRDAALANNDLFLIVAGAGLDGHVIHDLSAHRKGPISYLSYLLPTFRSVRAWNYPTLCVHIGEKLVFGPAQGMVMVGHVKQHGIGFSFLSRADPTDRHLDVLAFPCRSFVQGLATLLLAALRRHTTRPGTLYTTTPHPITITSPTPIPVQIDGEPAGYTPLTVTPFPHQIPFLAPRPG